MEPNIRLPLVLKEFQSRLLYPFFLFFERENGSPP